MPKDHMMSAHAPGSSLVVRTVTEGRIRWAAPAIAVRDDAEAIAYFRPPGGVVKITQGARWNGSESRPERESRLRQELLEGSWTLVDKTLTNRRGSLIVASPDDWFSVKLTQSDAGDFTPTYVNIQRPYRRSMLGYDTDDLCLDLVVQEDGSHAIKDEDEFNERCSLGLYAEQEQRAILAARDAAIERIESRSGAFDGSWRTWRASDDWPRDPALPQTWDTDATSPLPVGGAAVVVRNQAGEVLLVKENYGHRRWSLPGGRRDGTESDGETAIRETLEETGLQLRLTARLGTFIVVGPRPHQVAVFLGTATGVPAVQDPGEIEAMDWFAPTDLPDRTSNVLPAVAEELRADRRGVVREVPDRYNR